MNLIIINPQALDLKEFITNCLIPEIQFECFSRLDMRLCNNWTKYFNQVDLGWNKAKDKTIVPSGYDVIMAGINNITYSKQGDDYRIFINNNEIVPKGCAKLNDICHLINYGNLSVSPYPIFSESFRTVDLKVNDLYDSFMEGN